jgi:hypothetical protein
MAIVSQRMEIIFHGRLQGMTALASGGGGIQRTHCHD